MIFKKEDLAFLNTYAHFSNNNEDLNSKVQVTFDNVNNRICFCLSTIGDVRGLAFMTIFDNVEDIKDNFFSVYDIISLNRIIQLSQQDTKIKFTEEGIFFDNESKYELKKYEYPIPEYNTLLDYIYNKTPSKTIHLIDLEKLKPCISFVGETITEVNKNSVFLDMVVSRNKHYISSNEDVTSIVKTSNSIEDLFYISKNVATVIQYCKLKEIDIDIYEKENQFKFKIGDTYVFSSMITQSSIPDVFDDDIKSYYDHKSCIIVDRKELLTAVERLKVVTRKVFSINIKKDSITIENKVAPYAIETIKATVDEELINSNLLLSSIFFSTIVSIFNGDKIKIKVPSDLANNVAIGVEDETQDKIIIQCLYEEVQFTMDDGEI